MKTLDAKQHVMDEGGFSYNIDRALYVNRKAKKAFSAEFVLDHDVTTLEKCVQEHRPDNGWHFYFNMPPSESVRRDLEASLG